MTDKELAAIKAAHDSFDVLSPGWEDAQEAHANRAALLAEIERLRENVDRAGKEAERADRLRAEIARVKADERKNRAKNEWLRAEIERLRERLLQERAALVLDEIGAALERERVLRAALTDMLSGWRYIRDTYGDLAGVGWDRAEQKAREALEGKR